MESSIQQRGGTSRRLAFARGNPVLRPPWTDEALVRARCTSCGDCLRACPEAILVKGPAGTPRIDFARGACTFCGACAEACKENVFGDTSATPWHLKVRVTERCFLHLGVSCQSCTDACDTTALRFDMRGGVIGQIDVSPDDCTGCGACVSVCPGQAIEMAAPEPSRGTAA